MGGVIFAIYFYVGIRLCIEKFFVDYKIKMTSK